MSSSKQRTQEHPEFPNLGIFLIDFVVAALIAWVIPDGVNFLFRTFGRSAPLNDLTVQSRSELFLVTALLGYGFIVTRASAGYLRRVTAVMEEELPKTVGDRAQLRIDQSIRESIAGILLKGSRLTTAQQVEQAKVIQYFLKRTRELPLTMQKVTPIFAIDYLDECFNSLHTLGTATGLEVGVHRNVQLIISLAEDSHSFLYIDPVVYKNIGEDWSQAWWGLLRHLRDRPTIKKTYVILNAPDSGKSAAENQAVVSQVRDLQRILEDHGFEVKYCAPIDLRRVDPTIDLLTTAMSVVDQTDIILNTAKDRYTDEKVLGTRVLVADERYQRFVRMISEYSRPISQWTLPRKP